MLIQNIFAIVTLSEDLVVKNMCDEPHIHTQITKMVIGQYHYRTPLLSKNIIKSMTFLLIIDKNFLVMYKLYRMRYD